MRPTRCYDHAVLPMNHVGRVAVLGFLLGAPCAGAAPLAQISILCAPVSAPKSIDKDMRESLGEVLYDASQHAGAYVVKRWKDALPKDRCASDECLVAAAKKAKADFVLVGNVVSAGEGFDVSVRVVPADGTSPTSHTEHAAFLPSLISASQKAAAGLFEKGAIPPPREMPETETATPSATETETRSQTPTLSETPTRTNTPTPTPPPSSTSTFTWTHTSSHTPTPAPTSGSIEVASDPPGASIWLDGTDTGKVSPVTIPGLAFGAHAIQLKKAGYRTARAETKLTVEAPHVKVSGKLAGNVELRLQGLRDGFDVQVDGRPLEENSAKTVLPPGPHKVSVESSLTFPYALDVNVPATEFHTVTLQPRLRPPFSLAWTSLLAPGSGQIRQGRTGDGVAWIGAIVVAGAGALYFKTQGDKAYDDYLRLPQSTEIPAIFDAEARYKDADDKAQALLISAVALWGLNAIDAYVFAPRPGAIGVGAKTDF